MLTLGIETSCDETAVSVLMDGKRVLAGEISSQVDAHAAFGGIVPELAARMHVECINHLLEAALKNAGVSPGDINLVAVTVGPGLIVSLVVGIACARALGAALDVPVIGVNHLEAHIMANFLSEPEPELPALCLLVPGGHTELILMKAFGDYEILGRTRDDAAGEAFDKVARLLGLGYPGGPAIQKAAAGCTVQPVALPRPMLNNPGLEFSFSGLKTAVIHHLKNQEKQGLEIDVAAVAAGFQEAVVDVLVRKTRRAAKRAGVSTVLLCGGVAANAPLREQMSKMCAKQGLNFFMPPLPLCMDNAIMVAKAGHTNFHKILQKTKISPQPGMTIQTSIQK